MSEQSTTELRDGWRMARVGDILKVRNGYAFKSTDYQPEGVPLIRQSNLGDDVVEVAEAKRVDSRYLTELPGFVVRDGDLLIGMSGSLGKIARYQHAEPALQNQRTGLLQVKPEHEAKFAKLVLKFVEPQILAEGKGIAVQNVSAKEIEDCTFPLPPLPEQRRIVAEIEKQFTRLEAGVAALRRVQANLKRYRAAVLKTACEGPWPVTTLGKCFEVDRGRFGHRPRNEPRFYNGKYPFVQIGNLPRQGGAITTFTQTLNEQGLAISRMFPSGTVLIAIVGATIANTGILTFDSCAPDSLVALQSDNETLLKFAEFYLCSKKLEIRNTSYSSGGQPNINLAFLRAYPMPLPPLAEQTRIVAEVERRLSVVEELESVVSANLQRASSLRQSILKKAFTGELV